jgi:hypothetical protein
MARFALAEVARAAPVAMARLKEAAAALPDATAG